MDLKINSIQIVDEEDFAELLGHKLVVQLGLVHEYEDYDYDIEDIGEMTVYIYDENDGNLFIQADAHSGRLASFLEDVNVIEQDDERYFETLHFIKLNRSKMAYYLSEEEGHLVADVAGRIALIDHLQFVRDDIDADVKKQAYDIVSEKLMNFFHAHYVLAKTDTYVPSNFPITEPQTDEDYEKNNQYFKPFMRENINILKDLGFVKTGRETYVIKNTNYQ